MDGLVMHSPVFQAGLTKIVGPAFTVKFVPKDDKDSPSLENNYVSYKQNQCISEMRKKC